MNLETQGYLIEHDFYEQDGKRLLVIVKHPKETLGLAAFQSGTVGSAEFSFDGKTLVPESLLVLGNHRRKGIATAMYAYAETLQLGYKIRPSRIQTKEGKAFWDARKPPNRRKV